MPKKKLDSVKSWQTLLPPHLSSLIILLGRNSYHSVGPRDPITEPENVFMEPKYPLKVYFLLKIVIFHCYVSLPEGIYVFFDVTSDPAMPCAGNLSWHP